MPDNAFWLARLSHLGLSSIGQSPALDAVEPDVNGPQLRLVAHFLCIRPRTYIRQQTGSRVQIFLLTLTSLAIYKPITREMSLVHLSSSQRLALTHKSSDAGSQSAAIKDLESTVARFQAILTDDDRFRLQGLKASSHDAQSVIIFTAELDGLDTNRRGKSIATRLSSFLQMIEQYTKVVDTYISSNPNIAALIWASVRLTFLVSNLANTLQYEAALM